RSCLPAYVCPRRDRLSPLWRLMSNDDAASLLALAPQGPRDERFYVLCRTGRTNIPNGNDDANAVERASIASEPRARERVGESEGRSPSDFERISLPPHAFVDSVEVGFALDASVRVSTPSGGIEQANLAQHLREQAPSR